MLRLIESVVLLTKLIVDLNPLVLSIIVCVALRLISYKNALLDRIAQDIPPDCIVQKSIARLYCTWASV